MVFSSVPPYLDHHNIGIIISFINQIIKELEGLAVVLGKTIVFCLLLRLRRLEVAGLEGEKGQLDQALCASPPRSSSENMANTQLSRPPTLHLPFMSSIGQFGGVGGNLSSNIAGFQPQNDQLGSFQIGNGNNFSNILSAGGVEAQSSSMVGGDIRLKNSSGIDNPQLDRSVKPEDNPGLNLSRQFLGMLGNTNQQSWNGNSWAEFPGVSNISTSTAHFL
ncbi:hypothetical protein E3N88_43280 [Mikania micrantha]|uniref:Uncharacterized protein n=1 Tax=Mikania micrantha TaxID=192012 RepID=A0A5N6LFE4_9ASTR|nr:hypothetical protein E3N88_43280 [Mikania micrantha]